jgi:hypothetical protein
MILNRTSFVYKNPRVERAIQILVAYERKLIKEYEVNFKNFHEKILKFRNTHCVNWLY